MYRLVVALCLVGSAVCGPPVSKSRSEIEKFRDFLENTRIDHGVLVDESALSPDGSIWEKSGKYQGDILLYDDQVESMVDEFAQGRSAYIRPGSLWPNGVVVYEIGPGFTQLQVNHIYYTMRILQERTCIRFRRRNPREYNYVLVTGDNTGCWAGVGFRFLRGRHSMNIMRDFPGLGCFNSIVIIHEWLHVIGFFHMQSTYTRDDYVRINWENIVSGMEHNFDRYDNNLVSNLGLPYEYDSCMHYSARAFTNNGRTTIDALKAHSGVMGQQRYVTAFDFLRVDRHYKCAAWRSETDYQHLTLEEIEAGFPAFLAELELKGADEIFKGEDEELYNEGAEERV